MGGVDGFVAAGTGWREAVDFFYLPGGEADFGRQFGMLRGVGGGGYGAGDDWFEERRRSGRSSRVLNRGA